MIQIENINVSYQQTLALDNITLNLDGPSITGIIGPNGAGKSTLIKALIGISLTPGNSYSINSLFVSN